MVVGASAGGVESLRAFVAGLDPDLPAAVLVVLHLPSTGASMLSPILARAGALPVSTASINQSLIPGTIVVAPPDNHLILVDGHTTLTRGPRENGSRPAVDVLFRTAAYTCGPRVIGVILSGALDDGTAGMLSIRQRGGTVLAQDPSDAAYAGMPASVIRNVGADVVGTVAELAAAVNRLTREPPPSPAPPAGPSAILTREVEIADLTPAAFSAPDRPGVPAGFSCPDCSGSLFQIDDGGLLRFRCRVGHAWSSLGLLAKQSDALDDALWIAFRTLQEKAALSDQLAGRAAERGNTLSQNRYLDKALEARRSAELIRRLFAQPLSTLPVDDPTAEEENVDRR